jgi:hypothetical protein
MRGAIPPLYIFMAWDNFTLPVMLCDIPNIFTHIVTVAEVKFMKVTTLPKNTVDSVYFIKSLVHHYAVNSL